MAATKPNEVDVLIIGAGPSGLMLALWMARLGVKARIVDKRTAKIFSGQADGIQARTLEILDSFGIGQRVWTEANHMLEVSFWNPDETGQIRRSSRVPNSKPGLSRFTECVLHQGRMEQFFLDAIRASHDPSSADPPLVVERMVMPTSMVLDENEGGNGNSDDDYDAHPVTVTLRHLTEAEATPTQMLSNMSDGLFRSNLTGDDSVEMLEKSRLREAREETVRAKYVVGCDGAHSWTRKMLGKEFEMVGEMTDFIWGVMDIVPVTDFPDIRTRTMIHSASSGSMMIIPRENRLVRLYIQLKEVSAGGGRVDRSKITPDFIFKTAQRIISPFQLAYHYCDWWTAYQIGQRVGPHFSKRNRIFLAGDAVHTHSPKAGQGMNVSMQDTYNLGWKLGLVCKGVLRRDVLSTYELERKQIADQLIAFDHKFSRLFSGRPAKDILDETGVSMEEFSKAFELSHMFTTGIGIQYMPSILTTTPGTPLPATACVPGTRFPSFQVLSQFDARPWHLQQRLPSDGRFRVIVFGGDVAGSPMQLRRVNTVGAFVADRLVPRLPRLRLSPAASPHDGIVAGRLSGPSSGAAAAAGNCQVDPSVLELLLLHCSPRHALEPLRDLHPAYYTCTTDTTNTLGYDYGRVFADGPSYHEGDGRAYEGYGVDKSGPGCVLLVRPDGYVVGVVGLAEGEGDGMAACETLEGWLAAMIRTRDG